jgi:hypothetical protein
MHPCKHTKRGVEDIFTWLMLKLEPKKPTTNNIKSYTQYVNKLKAIRQQVNINLDFIAQIRALLQCSRPSLLMTAA